MPTFTPPAQIGQRSIPGSRVLGKGSSTRTGGSSYFKGLTGPVDIKRPVVERPAFGDYGAPNREGIGEQRGEALGFLGEYNNPTKSDAYGNILNVANERTAIAAAEEGRVSREAAQRRGYGGGGASATSRRAAQDRMVALALTAGEAATSIREQGGEMYKGASKNYTDLVGGYNAQMADRNMQYAGALQEARRLQAELDSAFNNQLIDAAKYEQMSSSIEAQLEAQREKLAEEKRQFDLSLPLNWADAETRRIGAVGSERYVAPAYSDTRLQGPGGMEGGRRPRAPQQSPFGPAFGMGRSQSMIAG